MQIRPLEKEVRKLREKPRGSEQMYEDWSIEKQLQGAKGRETLVRETMERELDEVKRTYKARWG